MTVKFNAVITNTIKKASEVASEGIRLLSATNQEAWLQQNVSALQSFDDMVSELENIAEENDIEDYEDVIEEFRDFLSEHLENELDSVNCAVRFERSGFDNTPKIYNMANPELADALKIGNDFELLKTALDVNGVLIDDIFALDGMTLEGEITDREIEELIRKAFPDFENELVNGRKIENYARKLLADALTVRQSAEEISRQVEELEDAEELYLDIMVHGIDSLFMEWLEDEGIM